MMKTEDIRKKYLEFFEERGHARIPSASLIPEKDESVKQETLFITAGMQPLVPYLLGKKHPAGDRLVDVQKCIRTKDIDDVGDDRHLTFFEMLGNWSLDSSYSKEDAITWSFEFLTDKEKGLGLDPNRLYVTVFKGEDGIPRDDQSIKTWQKVFLDKAGIEAEVAGEDEVIEDNIRIIPLGKNDNFWIAGYEGPCGGDTEMFYDVDQNGGKLNGRFSDLVDSSRIIEIWNDVFMEYNRRLTSIGEEKILIGNHNLTFPEDYFFEPLTQKNIDTGMGLERMMAVLNEKKNVYETDLFQPLLLIIKKQSGKEYEGNERAFRVLADHMKAAIMILGDKNWVAPSNVGQGYVLRRLIRRATVYAHQLGIKIGGEIFATPFSHTVMDMYKDIYPELSSDETANRIYLELNKEYIKFSQTLDRGLKEFKRLYNKKIGEVFEITGDDLFNLYSTYGFPVESSFEEIDRLRRNNGLPSVPEDVKKILIDGFTKKLREHQELSRTASAGQFKGGLADAGVETTRLHTAAHLMLAALRKVLGDHVQQKGSNITAERLRFDFSHPQKVTPEEIKKVEDIVNEQIVKKTPVQMEEMTVDEAKASGATGVFEHKYGDKVKVYTIGDFSKEICGGPHVDNIGELGRFKIIKEEASSAGIRRIKAVLEH